MESVIGHIVPFSMRSETTITITMIDCKYLILVWKNISKMLFQWRIRGIIIYNVLYIIYY